MNVFKTKFTKIIIPGMGFFVNVFTSKQLVRSLSAGVVRAITMFQFSFEERRLYKRILAYFPV